MHVIIDTYHNMLVYFDSHLSLPHIMQKNVSKGLIASFGNLKLMAVLVPSLYLEILIHTSVITYLMEYKIEVECSTVH